mmetsp:Transcript_116301/g.353783  ORF Transcript_116301/g.353783 Transcript_116301/m.353783 type:complete len:225 (-) Transcript_116301:29-703(-)
MACRMDFTELRPEDLDLAASLAARAFVDSPPYRYACSDRIDAAHRERFLHFLFLGNFALGARHGCFHCAYTGDEASGDRELVCFLMLVPEGSGPRNPSLCDILRMGILGSTVRFGLRPTLALVRITMWVEQLEEEVLQGRPVVRLEAMTVPPLRQGCGIGSRALRHALSELDAQGLDVFLATQDERNVRFYRRLGFDVLREAEYEPGGFTTWFMLRAPGPAAEL